MTIHASGTPITFDEIVAEFGGVPPHSLSEYYRGGVYVPNGPAENNSIPTAGTINMSNFYGAVNDILVSIEILLVGGGGAGGTGSDDSVGGGGAGGGGGGVNYTSWTGTSKQFSASIAIGAGGAYTAYMTAAPGGTGGTSSITGTVNLYAYGGNGGQCATGKWQSGSSAAGGAGGVPNGSTGGGYNSAGGSNGVGAGGGGGGRDDGICSGKGGNGYYWSIGGYYVGGGGGGGGDANVTTGAGGAGGGAAGFYGSVQGQIGPSGTNGLGGGGGGGCEWNLGTAGGSGRAVLSYVSATQLYNGGSITTSGSGASTRWFHTYTGSGTFTHV